MADVDEKKSAEEREAAQLGTSRDPLVSQGEADELGPAESLGADKYVYAAFFGVGIGVAYLTGKLLATLWSVLVEWPWMMQTVPWLLRYAEDERPTFTTAVGAVVGIAVAVACLRNEGIRRWAEDVAIELSKVTWPKKETVTNGTIVVIAAGLFATIYIGLLDRLWGFVTMLVYGA